ncbi:MAG: cation diffusion facilitator family transporter [Gammaproteobacteria bacterium]|jgi:ferrous-iron efflux pump FieF
MAKQHAGYDGRSRLLTSAGIASVSVAVTLIGLKLWAWWTTHSVALLSSFADSMLDLVASLITLFALRFAMTPADAEHRFGHGKSEALAGVAQSVFILASAAFVGWRVVERFINPLALDEPEVGFLVVAISFVLTTALVLFQAWVVRHTGSLAVKADAAHYRADLLTTIALAGALYFSTQLGWLYADPIFGSIVVFLILASVREILANALRDLLDHELPENDREAIEVIALAHQSVLGVHDIRTRSSGADQFIQFHLELDSQLTLEQAHAISDEVEAQVRATYPAAEVLIHADPTGNENGD